MKWRQAMGAGLCGAVLTASGVTTAAPSGPVAPRREAPKVKAAPRKRVARAVPPPKPTPCFHAPVHFQRGFGGDAEPVILTRCDGSAAPNAIEQLSMLVRPMNLPRPTELGTRIRNAAERPFVPGVKLIHEGLVSRLQRVVDRFRAKKIVLVSGYRPTSLGSFHQSARALDLHVDGVTNEALVAFCRTLPDTGCGYYPNSSFVHLDVRPPKTGHVYWIDASGPGEPARYVASWPPRASAVRRNDGSGPAVPLDDHTHGGAGRRLPLGASDTKIDAETTSPWSGLERFDPFSP